MLNVIKIRVMYKYKIKINVRKEHQIQSEVLREYIITDEDVEKYLVKINSNKAVDSGGLPAWIFHNFRHIFARPLHPLLMHLWGKDYIQMTGNSLKCTWWRLIVTKLWTLMAFLHGYFITLDTFLHVPLHPLLMHLWGKDYIQMAGNSLKYSYIPSQLRLIRRMHMSMSFYVTSQKHWI